MELTHKCSTCQGDLGADMNEVGVVDVDICSDCVSDAKKAASKEGYDLGYDVGHDDGLQEGRDNEG